LGSKLFDEVAQRLNVRVIGIDRPGMGLSDYKSNRKLLNWPDDVIELADALAIDRFPIVGGSGGVPSVLACAYKIPDRLTAVGVLFGPRPLGEKGATAGWSRSMRVQAFIGRNCPLWIEDQIMKALALAVKRNPESAVQTTINRSSKADKAVLNQPMLKQLLIDCIRESFRSGSRGCALDFVINMKSWGFNLEDIRIPINLWHGEDDNILPVAMGKYLANIIPHCHAQFLPHEGHYSLIPNHATEILNTLIPS
jgi:pimeloyl-ACP methyl ester carboxylesterase